MSRIFGTLAFLALSASLAAQEPKPFSLAKLDPKKVPAAFRPMKGMPPEVVAVVGLRTDRMDAFALRGDGRFLALTGPDEFVRVWDLDGIKLVSVMKQPDIAVCLTFTPDGKRLITGDASGMLRIFEKATDQRVPTFKVGWAAHKDGPVWTAAASPNGKLLASGGRDKLLKLWDIAKAKPTAVASLAGHDDGVRSLAFTPDGARLVSVGGDDRQLRLWSVTDGKATPGDVVKLPGRTVGVVVSSNGELLATAGGRGASQLWTFKEGKLTLAADLETGNRPVVSIAFAPDGSRLAGIVPQSDTAERLLVWNKDGTKAHEFDYDMHLHAVGFSNDGQHLIAVGELGTLLIRLPAQ